jgi:cell division protein FtsQ
MPSNVKKSYDAKRYRMVRRFGEVSGDFFRAFCVLFCAAALTCVFIYVYSYLLSCPYFSIRETSVRGLNELTEKDILTLADIKPAQNLLAVNKTAIERRVRDNPWVKNLYVGRELPDRLVLELKERQPLALLKSKNDFYLVDTEGSLFKKINQHDEVDLPVITGVDEEGKTKQLFFKSALDLVKMLESNRKYSYLGTISEVNIDELFALSVLTEKGLYLKLGTDGVEDKLGNLKIVMADLEKKGMAKGLLCIDLGDASKITVQRKNIVVNGQGETKGKRYQI